MDDLLEMEGKTWVRKQLEDISYSKQGSNVNIDAVKMKKL